MKRMTKRRKRFLAIYSLIAAIWIGLPIKLQLEGKDGAVAFLVIAIGIAILEWLTRFYTLERADDHGFTPIPGRYFTRKHAEEAARRLSVKEAVAVVGPTGRQCLIVGPQQPPEGQTEDYRWIIS